MPPAAPESIGINEVSSDPPAMPPTAPAMVLPAVPMLTFFAAAPTALPPIAPAMSWMMRLTIVADMSSLPLKPATAGYDYTLLPFLDQRQNGHRSLCVIHARRQTSATNRICRRARSSASSTSPSRTSRLSRPVDNTGRASNMPPLIANECGRPMPPGRSRKTISMQADVAPMHEAGNASAGSNALRAAGVAGKPREGGGVVLEASGVSKSFGGIAALVDVDFDLRAGEVHALVGENGAGKSTLMKILAGVHVEYDGVIRLTGAPVKFAGVQDAERAGVAIIHQELDLVPELTAADNIFLGREPLIAGTIVDRRRIAKAADGLLRRLGIDIDPQSRLAELRVGEQQLVEIAKALSLDARILMMDEPTSALSTSECETLFKVVRQLAAAGVAIIFTSHRIDEVVALADRVTVLRDGRRVLTAPIEDLSSNAIISAMVGRNFIPTHRELMAVQGAPVLSVRDLTLDT